MQPWMMRAGLCLRANARVAAHVHVVLQRRGTATMAPCLPATRTLSSKRSAALLAQQHRHASSAGAGEYAYTFDKLFDVNHQGLPRVTVPPLADTVQRYLNSTEHLCASPEELASVMAAAKEFLEGPGPGLQAALVARDAAFAADPSGPAFYFEEAWDDGYLGARCPSPININPFYILARHTAPHLQDRTGAAAHLVQSMVKFQGNMIGGTSQQEKTGGCVATLGRQLGTARIPGHTRDGLQVAPRSKHMVFQWHGAFYTLEYVRVATRHTTRHALRPALSDALLVPAVANRTYPCWYRTEDYILRPCHYMAGTSVAWHSLLSLSVRTPSPPLAQRLG